MRRDVINTPNFHRRLSARVCSCRLSWLCAAVGTATIQCHDFGFTAVSLICFSLVAYGLLNSRSTGARARVLRSPLLVILGKYSYGMYVLHLPVAFFWPRFFRPGLIGDSRIGTAVMSVLCGR